MGLSSMVWIIDPGPSSADEVRLRKVEKGL
jgi:hypothetical protein